MLNQIRNSLYRFMIGRYGFDQLNGFLLVSYALLTLFAAYDTTILGNILRMTGYALFLVALFRTFSRKIYRRQKENIAFMNLTRPVRQAFGLVRRWFKVVRLNFNNKTHKHYLCPQCSKIVRVPKGRGTIEISCPHCKAHFERRT